MTTVPPETVMKNEGACNFAPLYFSALTVRARLVNEAEEKKTRGRAKERRDYSVTSTTAKLSSAALVSHVLCARGAYLRTTD